MNILISGGCGYIGSHTVQAFSDAGHHVTVFDNLSSGRRGAALQAELCVGDLADCQAMDAVFAARNFSAVVHCAASISSPQSIEQPLDYYANNVSNTLNLLRCCCQHQVKYFLYASSAAVYGLVSGSAAIDEEAPIRPLSPYGWSKWMGERMLIDIAARHGLRYAALRFYNVAGADPQGRFGQSPTSHHLIRVACQTALNGQSSQGMTIFGDDYDTADGSCVRDYIHVTDLADIHVQVMDYLLAGHDSMILNCGYGHGYSVKEIIDVVRRVSGCELSAHVGARRLGDPPSLIADVGKMKHALAWQPHYDNIDKIVAHAWQWEQQLQAGVWDST